MSSVAETAAAPSAPPVVDVAAMLTPIPGDNPAGEPPSVLYDEVMKARSADDPKAADLGKVLSLTTGALTTRTKDLTVCAWMTEALVKLHGLAGLRDGLRVLRGLQESFWENLYPAVGKNGDLEARAYAIAAFGRWSAAALREVPLTDAKVSGAVYTYNKWLRSSRDSEEAKKLAEGWANATEATPADFYTTAHATIEECWAEFEALAEVMRERFGAVNLDTGPLKDTLEEVRGLIGELHEEKLKLELPPDEPGQAGESPDGAEADADAGTRPPAAATATTIRTRQEAVRQLREVAAFFRRTEPHSPVAYLVERAISWSGMPLEAWLASVIKDDGVLKVVRETLGVEPDGGGGFKG